MPSYTVGYDERAGMIRCRYLGLMTVPETQQFIQDMFAAYAIARQHGSSVRSLIDNRIGVIVPPTMIEDFKHSLRTIRQPQDRTAILVASSLAKMQAKRSMSEGSEVFISEGAALTWLNAWVGQKAGPVTSPA